MSGGVRQSDILQSTYTVRLAPFLQCHLQCRLSSGATQGSCGAAVGIESIFERVKTQCRSTVVGGGGGGGGAARRREVAEMSANTDNGHDKRDRS